MKAKRQHHVPLCGQALEILDVARQLGDGPRQLVFPMRSGRPIATSTLPRMLQHHEIVAVPHGFRSSFRDWAAKETDHPREVIEAALAHVVQNKVEAAYARTAGSSTLRVTDRCTSDERAQRQPTESGAAGSNLFGDIMGRESLNGGVLRWIVRDDIGWQIQARN